MISSLKRQKLFTKYIGWDKHPIFTNTRTLSQMLAFHKMPIFSTCWMFSELKVKCITQHQYICYCNVQVHKQGLYVLFCCNNNKKQEHKNLFDGQKREVKFSINFACLQNSQISHVQAQKNKCNVKACFIGEIRKNGQKDYWKTNAE